jgi:hypothetical protein
MNIDDSPAFQLRLEDRSTQCTSLEVVDTDTNSGLADSAEVQLCRIWDTDKKEGEK